MKHGGRRRGAGRPPRAGEPTKPFVVRLTEAERAEIADGLLEGETLSDVLREGGLALVRRRRDGR